MPILLDETNPGWATVPELGVRLDRDFEDDDPRAVQALTVALAAIVLAANRHDNWAEEIETVPRPLWAIHLELAARSMSNPLGVQTESEQLGVYQHSLTYERANGAAVSLSEQEKRDIRRILSGVTFAAVTLSTPYSGEETAAEPELPLD